MNARTSAKMHATRTLVEQNERNLVPGVYKILLAACKQPECTCVSCNRVFERRLNQVVYHLKESVDALADTMSALLPILEEHQSLKRWNAICRIDLDEVIRFSTDRSS